MNLQAGRQRIEWAVVLLLVGFGGFFASEYAPNTVGAVGDLVDLHKECRDRTTTTHRFWNHSYNQAYEATEKHFDDLSRILNNIEETLNGLDCDDPALNELVEDIRRVSAALGICICSDLFPWMPDPRGLS